MTSNNQIVAKSLSTKAKLRKAILDAYLAKEIDRESAIRRLVISKRQFIRIVKDYKVKGCSLLS